jgi:hypothetical protein
VTTPKRQFQLTINGHGTTYGVFEPPAELGIGDLNAYEYRFKVEDDEYLIVYPVGFLKCGDEMKPALFAPTQEAMVFFCLSALDPLKASWYIDPNRCGIAVQPWGDEGRKRQLLQLTHKMIGDKWTPGVAVCVKYLPGPTWETNTQEHGW